MIWLFLGIALGAMIGYNLREDSCDDYKEDLDRRRKEINQLEKEINYYKDLCAWHVEEKDKLKREHYIK